MFWSKLADRLVVLYKLVILEFSAWKADSAGNWTNRRTNWLQEKPPNLLFTFCIKPIFKLIPLVPIPTLFMSVKRKLKPWKFAECQPFAAIKSGRWRSCTDAVSDRSVSRWGGVRARTCRRIWTDNLAVWKCCNICHYFKMFNALDLCFSGVFTGLTWALRHAVDRKWQWAGGVSPVGRQHVVVSALCPCAPCLFLKGALSQLWPLVTFVAKMSELGHVWPPRRKETGFSLLEISFSFVCFKGFKRYFISRN